MGSPDLIQVVPRLKGGCGGGEVACRAALFFPQSFLNPFASYLAAHFQEKFTEGFGEDL
jgi:hypothetical protein